MDTGPSTQRYSGLIGLSDTELDQIAGGGGKPPIGTGNPWPTLAIQATFPIGGSATGPMPEPEGSKPGVVGNNG
jgi:hypothetical protein